MAFSLFGNKKRPDDMLPDGWQFYSRPTSLEPPGVIFRIDHENKRFLVDQLRPKIRRGAEPGSAKDEQIQTKAGILARLFGLKSVGANASLGSVRAFQFRIVDPIRESTADADMDRVFKPYLAKMDFRPKNRYYLVREARSALGMTFALSHEQVGELGGEAAMLAAGEGSLSFTARDKLTSQLTLAFPERLGVMFLAEQIVPAVAGLAAGAGQFDRVAVSSVLDWVEPEGNP